MSVSVLTFPRNEFWWFQLRSVIGSHRYSLRFIIKSPLTFLRHFPVNVEQYYIISVQPQFLQINLLNTAIGQWKCDSSAFITLVDLYVF